MTDTEPPDGARPFGIQGRGARAGTAAALVSLGGLGRFALGHVSADDERIGLVGTGSEPGDHEGSTT